MRKSNSIFKTAFVSESGAGLTNNDYFAFVEHDDYACYVLASGITDFESSVAAKEAVENLILSFEEKPSMTKTTLLQYMKETNERLYNSANNHRLKASVIMVVTDYEKFRYVSAGNVRLRMYRNGRLFLNSKDMSLANDLIEKGENETLLDKHEERHNLYTYLGKKDFFKPYVSKVEKLEDTDIIALYSQGFWENVDSQEIDEIFSEASEEPQESVDILEDVLLSRQPEDLKSYTVAAIFVNKAFRDPERERKRLFYIKVAVIATVIIIVLAIIAYIFHSWHQSKVEELDRLINSTVEYMDSSNFVRAQETCQEALKLAKSLDEREKELDLEDYLILFDKIIRGDELFFNEQYSTSYIAFKNALKTSAASNKKVYDYIFQRMNSIKKHIGMDEFLMLGDHALANGNFDEAEGMYLKARDVAETLQNIEGQQKAVQGIGNVYDKKAQLQKDNDKKLADKKQVAISDAMKKGDALLAAGDLDGAQAAYLSARNLSDNPADRQITSNALTQVADAKEKKTLEEKITADSLKELRDEATELEKQGDKSFDDKDYLTAQMYYMRAIGAFYDLKEEKIAATVQKKYDLASAKYEETNDKKFRAEAAEMSAQYYYTDKNFVRATEEATQAKEIYLEIGMKNKADEMDTLLQQIAVDAAIAEALK